MTEIVEPSVGIGHTAIEYLPDRIRIHLDIEDAQPEDVCIDVHEDEIEVVAPMREEVELEEGVMRKEGMISRTISLPGGLDLDGLECSTEDGHFDIIIPR